MPQTQCSPSCSAHKALAQRSLTQHSHSRGADPIYWLLQNSRENRSCREDYRLTDKLRVTVYTEQHINYFSQCTESVDTCHVCACVCVCVCACTAHPRPDVQDVTCCCQSCCIPNGGSLCRTQATLLLTEPYFKFDTKKKGGGEKRKLYPHLF